MKKIYLDRKLFSFLPALLLMVVIFWFSAQPADDSTQISISFSFILVKNFLHFISKGVTEEQLYELAVNIHGIIRKLAHFSEYAALSCFLHIPYFIYKKKENRYKLYILFTCFLYSCTDEIHQFFVPGRACRFLDVCIDTSGALSALLILSLLFALIHLRRRLPDSTR